MLNLYLVYRHDGVGYDEYDSMVVVSKNHYSAILYHPRGNNFTLIKGKWYFCYGDGRISDDPYSFHSWTEPDNLSVELIGKAKSTLKEGEVIIASFNAG